MSAPATAAAFARLVNRFAADESGATAIEYGLIAGGVGAVVAGAIYGLGSEVKNTLYAKLQTLF